jgi:hypothetical protein
MRKKAHTPISSETDEDAWLEAKRDEFLQEVFDAHKNRILPISKEQKDAILIEFEELDPEND